jgi:hypothetical protein
MLEEMELKEILSIREDYGAIEEYVNDVKDIYGKTGICTLFDYCISNGHLNIGDNKAIAEECYKHINAMMDAHQW